MNQQELYEGVCESAALIVSADLASDYDDKLIKFCVDTAVEFLIAKTGGAVAKDVLFSDYKTSCILAGVYFYNVFNKNMLSGIDYADFGNIKIKTDADGVDCSVYLTTALNFLKEYTLDDDFSFREV